MEGWTRRVCQKKFESGVLKNTATLLIKANKAIILLPYVITKTQHREANSIHFGSFASPLRASAVYGI
jgi:hypothetical protein